MYFDPIEKVLIAVSAALLLGALTHFGVGIPQGVAYVLGNQPEEVCNPRPFSLVLAAVSGLAVSWTYRMARRRDSTTAPI